MNLTACNLAQKLDSLQDIEGGKFEVVYASAESATRISNDNFNRGSFRRIQIVNIVFRQHIAVYRSKKFVVFSAVGKLQRFFTLNTGRFHYSLVAFCIGRIKFSRFCDFNMRTAACCRRQNIK